MVRKRKSGRGRYEFVGGFILLDKGDKREDEFSETRRRTGVSPDETWSLDISIARFLVPRLRMFKELTCGYPACLKGGLDEWRRIIGKMERAFKLIAQDKTTYSESEHNAIEKGLDLFRMYFHSLWW